MKINRVLRSLLPSIWHCNLLALIYPLIDIDRRGSKVLFTKSNGMFTVEYGNDSFNFLSAKRASRYIRPGGAEFIQKKLLQNYSHPEVFVESGDVVVEIGSNVGEFSTAIAQKVKTLFCFEPDPKVFSCLKINLCRYSNCVVEQLAIGNRSGEVDFFY